MCVGADKATGTFGVSVIQHSSFYRTPATQTLSVVLVMAHFIRARNRAKKPMPAPNTFVSVVHVAVAAGVSMHSPSTVASSSAGTSRFQSDFSRPPLPVAVSSTPSLPALSPPASPDNKERRKCAREDKDSDGVTKHRRAPRWAVPKMALIGCMLLCVVRWLRVVGGLHTET